MLGYLPPLNFSHNPSKEWVRQARLNKCNLLLFQTHGLYDSPLNFVGPLYVHLWKTPDSQYTFLLSRLVLKSVSRVLVWSSVLVFGLLHVLTSRTHCLEMRLHETRFNHHLIRLSWPENYKISVHFTRHFWHNSRKLSSYSYMFSHVWRAWLCN